MSIEKRVIEKIIGIEGGYVYDPNDSGMETMYGITVRVARAHGYTGLMRELPYETAYAIMKVSYWDKLRLSDIEVISEKIAEEIADSAINMGNSQAVKFLQKSLNALNNRSKAYPNMAVDGIIGIKTVHALKTFINWRKHEGEKVLFTLLNCLQGSFYVNLTMRREKDEKFLYGWIKNRVII